MAEKERQLLPTVAQPVLDGKNLELLREWVVRLGTRHTELHEDWVRRITANKLLTSMTKEEIHDETTTIYERWVSILEEGSYQALHTYIQSLSAWIIPREVAPHEMIGLMLILRDVFGKTLLEGYLSDFDLLSRMLDAYEPVANGIINTVVASFIQEREHVTQRLQRAVHELSTPVLQIRDRLLLAPIIGGLDAERARQLTNQLLHAIRDYRAKVVVIDVTGVPSLDSRAANYLVQTVAAARLLGASVIVTGMAPVTAQTLVNLGVDVNSMHTVGDLQGGIEEASRLLTKDHPGG